MASTSNESQEPVLRHTSVVRTQSPALVSYAELCSADDTKTTPVVVKTYAQRDVLRHGLEAAVRAERDALVRLSHAPEGIGVPRLLVARVKGGALTLLMARARGIPATELRLPLSPKQAASIATGVISALKVVHSHDVVHADVVPRNVLVEMSQKGTNVECEESVVGVCLVDFGSAFVRGAAHPHASWTSSPAALPPELRDTASRTPTPLADVWALGTLTWALLAKERDNAAHPIHLHRFLLGDIDLNTAFWGDCAPQKEEHPPDNHLLLAFNFVVKCLQQNPLDRFCAFSDPNSLGRASWNDIVDYEKLKAHPYLHGAAA